MCRLVQRFIIGQLAGLQASSQEFDLTPTPQLWVMYLLKRSSRRVRHVAGFGDTRSTTSGSLCKSGHCDRGTAAGHSGGASTPQSSFVQACCWCVSRYVPAAVLWTHSPSARHRPHDACCAGGTRSRSAAAVLLLLWSAGQIRPKLPASPNAV